MIDNKLLLDSASLCDTPEAIRWAISYLDNGPQFGSKTNTNTNTNTNTLRQNAALFSNKIAETIELFPKANINLITALRSLTKSLQTSRLTLSTDHRGRYIAGRLHVLDIITSHLSPVMEAIFPRRSIARSDLLLNDVFLLLSTGVGSFEDCLVVNKKIKKSIADLKSRLGAVSSEGWREITEAIYDLKLISDVLGYTQTSFVRYDIRWCRSCFRRVAGSSDYCTEHKPISSTPMDTEHRKAKRVRKNVNNVLAPRWARIVSIRRAIGDEVILISKATDPKDTSTAYNAICVDTAMAAFCSNTRNGDWKDVCERWDEVIDVVFTQVRKRFPNKAYSFSGWDKFRIALNEALCNKYETTRHPYWIIMMMAQAEHWFSAESDHQDHRRTSNCENVKALRASNPTMSQSDIGRELGISRQAVSACLR